jgi:glycyl-tRNA synthetase
MLKYDFNTVYDEKDAIGRRYRRQDAIGTPICVTVDHDTLVDGCVTIRHRDSMEQERVSIESLRDIIAREVDMRYALARLEEE